MVVASVIPTVPLSHEIMEPGLCRPSYSVVKPSSVVEPSPPERTGFKELHVTGVITLLTKQGIAPPTETDELPKRKFSSDFYPPRTISGEFAKFLR
jgi:hypothetical protein